MDRTSGHRARRIDHPGAGRLSPIAGPFTTRPSRLSRPSRPNQEPWQGQSHVRSVELQLQGDVHVLRRELADGAEPDPVRIVERLLRALTPVDERRQQYAGDRAVGHALPGVPGGEVDVTANEQHLAPVHIVGPDVEVGIGRVPVEPAQ